MAIFMHARKYGMKLFLFLLTLAVLLSMLPAALAEESSLGKVQVIVENTTFTSAVDGVAPAWTGELVNTEVELNSESTMLSCVQAALTANDTTCTIDDSGYITEIGNLKSAQAGSSSGWMGTLNDWFTSEGFGGFSVANGKLSAGDFIHVCYSKDAGKDLGGDFENVDKRLRSVSFSKGVLNADFAADTHEYTLTLPSDCTGIVVTPTAANKNYQVHTYVGETEYKRTATIPVENGMVITVKCGDKSWPSMSQNDSEAQVYTFTVSVTDEDVLLGEGTSGNTTWKMYESGLLEFYAVEGTDGKMKDATTSLKPEWVKTYASTITSVVIHEGVTKIGNYAFSGASRLTSVSIPASLTAIGTSAFNGVAFESFTAAEGGHFSVSNGLLLENNGTEINMIVDSSLSNGVVKVPEGVTKIGTTFKLKNITGIEFPSTLTEIAANAFQGCKKLTSVTIPCNLTKGNEFKNCTALAEVIVQDGVTSIVDDAFSGCTALKTVKLPKTLTSMTGVALNGCSAVAEIIVEEGGAFGMNGSLLMKNSSELVFALRSGLSGEIIIPEGTTVIGKSAFNACTGITGVQLPDTLTSIAANAFNGCTKLITVNLPSSIETIGEKAFYGCSKLKISALPDGLKTMGASAFANCTSIQEITIPCNISKSAFSGCTALTKVTLAEGAAAVADSAFSKCTKLKTVSLPSTLNSLSNSAFSGCTALTELTIAEGSTYSVTSSGLICKGTQVIGTTAAAVGALEIPSGITEIAASAFASNTKITSVKFPASVITIGANAFDSCTALTSVEFTEGLQTISSKAFYKCAKLATPQFPASLKKLDANAFDACTGMTGTLKLPGSIVTYGTKVFNGCTGLQAVEFEDSKDPDNVNYGSSLFYGCKGLETVRLPENITNMNSMLSGCSGIKRLTLPTGIQTVTMASLPSQVAEYLEFKGATYVKNMYAFKGLKELVLPATLTKYDPYNCNPQFVYFRGTEEQWNAITFNANTLSAFEKNGTIIIFNYDENNMGEAPVILSQPASVTYEQGLRPAPLTIEIREEEGAQYFYTWYCDGTEVEGEKECAVSTSEVGTHAYYCTIKCVKDGKISQVTSDTATVTVTEMGVAFVGEGTEESPYLLTSAKDLERLSVLVEGGESYKGKFFQMQNDIELPRNWVPIGCTKDGSDKIQSGKNMNAFSGTFDGNGKLLTVPAGEKPLFAYVYGANIKNLRIYGAQIDGYGLINNMVGVGLSGTSVIIDNVTIESGTKILKSGLFGGVLNGESSYAACAKGYEATVKNCTIKENVVIGYNGDQQQIGSFAGRFQGTIENCVSYATVKGTDYVGGVIGSRDNAMGNCIVKNCTFKGSVIASGKNAGGVAGGTYDNSSAPNGIKISVIGCTVTGTVNGASNVGGILGADEFVAQAWNDYTFKDNTFTGKVSGNANVGAIIGYYKSLNVHDAISGNQYSADCNAAAPVGCLWLIDTSCENPTAVDGVTYINTETDVTECPAVGGCSWLKGKNRTDDPLGADMDKLFSVIGGYTLGDVNNDGEINSMDVMLTNNAVRGKVTLTDAQTKAADVNGDGEINSLDVMKINDYARGKITAFSDAA